MVLGYQLLCGLLMLREKFIWELLVMPAKLSAFVVCPIIWFLHTLSAARALAIAGVIHRSTQRKDFLEKDDLKQMEAQLLLSLPVGLDSTDIEMMDVGLTISVRSTHHSSCCPPSS